eukprot:TRINITY_DN39410_c0_g1_i1.p1 TRINITY_DN39410_c0_g1~~TRINITY_DN39410_c0_g1_i1.p1  ORF type:complete len:257 (+),score=47.12 TRINITY_DN39410_c0_g1_i1:94-771(+)
MAAPAPTDLKNGDSYRGLTFQSACSVSKSTHIIVAQGSVVVFEGDAIVNAANVYNLGGGGVDGAITDAGGEKMAEEREAFPEIDGAPHGYEGEMIRLPEGQAQTTSAGNRGEGGDSSLKCRFVIHTVGPQFGIDEPEGERKKKIEVLASAYKTSLEEAAKNDVQSIGFALISAGVFRGDMTKSEVLGIGVNAIKEWVSGTESSVQEICLAAFSADEVEALNELMK